ncbi:MAG: macro domain-containing protein, partial [Planctomycetota bacterium]
MQWTVKHGDILDEPADVLICSANPFLTLSGGVGGALLQRYGDPLRIELEEVLKSRSVNYVDRGSVIVTFPSDTPYKSIIHAVAVDGMYESSS